MAVDLLSPYTASACTKAAVGRALRVTRTGANPYIQSPAGKGEVGKGAQFMWVRLVKIAGGAVGASWVGRITYARSGTGAHGISTSYRKVVAAPSGYALGDTIDLVFDMWALDAGGTDWKDGTVDQWRLEIDNDSGSVWDVYMISPANRAPTRNNGPLAGDAPQVTTDLVKPNDVVKPTLDAVSGPVLLPKKNLTQPTNMVLMHSVTLTLSGYGEVEVDWVGTVDFAHNDYGYFSLMIDTTPTYDGAGVINNYNQQLKIRASSALQLSQSFKHLATGLAAGSHTFAVYGQQDNDTPQHSIRDLRLTIKELKT